jgi:ADP-ribosyl-[dinitrogen reductase] hydrolase
MKSADDMSQRLLGGLWGAIIGDALGVPVEFTSREERRRDPVTDMRGYGTHRQPPGTWSDDSSMLLCTVEALREAAYQPARLASLFLAWVDRGHWTPHGTVFDIGIATRQALARIRRGVAPEDAGGIGEHDNGNGSLMRILPVALRYADAPAEEMLTMAHRISALTHRHPRSQMACGLYCLMISGLLLGLAPQEAYRAMVDQAVRLYAAEPFATELPHFSRLLEGTLADLPESAIASSGYVIHTLEAAIWCLLTTSTFEDAVLVAVNLGEDTDTTGCVVGGLAGAWYGLHALPDNWRSALVRAPDIAGLFAEFTRKDVEDAH